MNQKKASKAAKRQAKVKRRAINNNALKQARVGRFQEGRKIVYAEWGELVHSANVPVHKIHPDDIEKVQSAIAARKTEGIDASIKKRDDGSYVLVDNPARFDSADIAYDDGTVDPLDIIEDNGLPSHTNWLGYAICNGDGMFMSKDQIGLVDKAEKGYLCFDLAESDKLAGQYRSGFSSMVFDTGNNYLLAAVKPN